MPPSSIEHVPQTTAPGIEDTLIRGYRQLALETPARPRDLLLRFLDVVLSAFFLVLTLPFAVPIALLILLTSGTPVFYRGERVGRSGRVFTMLKFRTLKTDAESRLGPYLGEELVRRTQERLGTLAHAEWHEFVLRAMCLFYLTHPKIFEQRLDRESVAVLSAL